MSGRQLTLRHRFTAFALGGFLWAVMIVGEGLFSMAFFWPP